MKAVVQLAAAALLLASVALAGEAKKPKPMVKLSPELKKKLRGKILNFVEPPPVSDATKARVNKLIKDLGSDNFKTREAASDALVAAGQAALPALRAALKHKDPEVADRSGIAIERIKTDDLEFKLVEELRKNKAASLIVIDEIAKERAAELNKAEADRKKIEAAEKRKAADARIARLKATGAKLKTLRTRVTTVDHLREASALLHNGKYVAAEKLLNAFVKKPGADANKVRKVRAVMGLVRMLKTQAGAGNQQGWLRHIDLTLGIKKR